MGITGSGASILALLVLTGTSLYGQSPVQPTFSPAPGPTSVDCPATINISSTTPGALLVITSDGSQPTPGGTTVTSPQTINLTADTTFRAISLLPNGSSKPSTYPASAEADAAYKCTVLGFADLHSHPASHLAFGSSNGQNGLFWGAPADANNMSALTLANDLPACDAFDHNPGTVDPVQMFSDYALLSGLQSTVKLPYSDQGDGNPAFQSWPASLSLTHQQMDINSIQRAYNGGLRLMFASVTDDEVVSDLWNQTWSPNGAPPPVHNPWFDFQSAVRQLTFIQNMATANSSWMEIVTTPEKARSVINPPSNKLAVVLSLEMDTLSLDQILSLVQIFNVRHVIPVHLVDNPAFGGTAVYNDEFNAENMFFNGYFYKTPMNGDPNLTFNLSATPSVIIPLAPSDISSALNALGINPTTLIPGLSLICDQNIVLAFFGFPPAQCPVVPGEFGYIPWPLPISTIPGVIPSVVPGPVKSPGQFNTMGLNNTNFLALMQARCGSAPCGLLLDVVHMGEITALGALNLAGKYQYPLMDSHTGVRCDSPACSTTYGTVTTGGNERSLPVSQLQMIRNLGGVIGFGEVSGGEGSGVPDADPVGTWISGYTDVWNLMGNKGVALGTDTNGLSPLIPKDVIKTNYPITVAHDFGGMPPPPMPLNEFQYAPGSHKFDFEQDGIATYGMLPDFIQAASLRTVGVELNPPPPKAAIKAIFRSAEDTIEMWEGAVAAENHINPNSNQVPASCTIAAVGPWSAGSDTPVINQPVNFYTEIFDRTGQAMASAVNIAYSGNVPYPASPHWVTGMDQVSFTPTVPNNYTLTVTYNSSSTFTCSKTIALAPTLQSISSPLGPDPDLSWVPLANADGSTQLTLTGTGFTSPVTVSFGSYPPISVTPANDTTLVVKAPVYTGALFTNVSVFVSSSGILSNTADIQYFKPYAPNIAYSYSSQSCSGAKTFAIGAYLLDANAAFVENAPLDFKVGGINKTVNTTSPGDAGITGNFTSLARANQSTYTGSASYTFASIGGPASYTLSAAFTLRQPALPSPESCRIGTLTIKNPNSSGAIFNIPQGGCIACNLRDLPTDFNQTSYEIDDLFTLGALGNITPKNGIFSPNMVITRAGFLYSLDKVLGPSERRRLLLPNGKDTRYRVPITRGEAARMVADLTGIGDATGDVATRTATLLKLGYLHQINGNAASEQPLTKIEMVSLLWNVARTQLLALSNQTK